MGSILLHTWDSALFLAAKGVYSESMKTFLGWFYGSHFTARETSAQEGENNLFRIFGSRAGVVTWVCLLSK